MRKKFIAITGMAVVVALLVAVVVGCGSKSGGGGSGDTMAFFTQAKGQLSSATSFTLQGQLGVKLKGTSGQSSLIPSNMNVPFEGAMQKTGNVPAAKLSLDMSFLTNILAGLMGSSGLSSTTDVYFVDGKIYGQSPLDGAWYVADPATVPGLPSFITNQDYAQLLDWGKDVKVIQETSSTIKYELSVDMSKVPSDLSQIIAGLAEGQMTDAQLQAFTDNFKKSLSSMKLDVTVDKASGNPTEISTSVDISFQGLEDPTGGMMDIGTGATVSFDVNFADFGQKQDITLPEGAKNAKPVEDVTSGSLLNL